MYTYIYTTQLTLLKIIRKYYLYKCMLKYLFSCKYTKSVVACDNKGFLIFFKNNEIALILKLKDYFFSGVLPLIFPLVKKKSEKKKEKEL